MDVNERKYLALITYEDDTQGWQWLISHYLDSAWIEIRQIFQDTYMPIKDIQFVNADRWGVRYVDKEDHMHLGKPEHVIISYNHEDDHEDIVPRAFISVKELVTLPRDTDYGIMSSARFEVFFNDTGQLSVVLAHDNEVSYEAYDRIMNLSWWFDEAKKRLREIQENRDEYDILIGPGGEDCCIKWADKVDK